MFHIRYLDGLCSDMAFEGLNLQMDFGSNCSQGHKHRTTSGKDCGESTNLKKQICLESL